MTHAGALAPAIEAMMDEDPASRWDMATSAKRLGGIAAIEATAILPVVGAGDIAILPAVASGDTAVMPVDAVLPPVEATRQLDVAAPPPPPPHDRGSGRRRVSLALGALLLAAIGMAFFVNQLGD